MYKYEIYQAGNEAPLTTVEAARIDMNTDHEILFFYDLHGDTIAAFSFKNMTGFKRIDVDDEV